ncbi:MAG: hypothetical protein ACSHXB_13330 [Sulfitobacter sp.]
MSHLHNPSNPRHTRMFELLRQTEQAMHTMDRIKVTAVKELDEHVAQKIRENAVHSLRFHGAVIDRH